MVLVYGCPRRLAWWIRGLSFNLCSIMVVDVLTSILTSKKELGSLMFFFTIFVLEEYEVELIFTRKDSILSYTPLLYTYCRRFKKKPD